MEPTDPFQLSTHVYSFSGHGFAHGIPSRQRNLTIRGLRRAVRTIGRPFETPHELLASSIGDASYHSTGGTLMRPIEDPSPENTKSKYGKQFLVVGLMPIGVDFSRLKQDASESRGTVGRVPPTGDKALQGVTDFYRVVMERREETETAKMGIMVEIEHGGLCIAYSMKAERCFFFDEFRTACGTQRERRHWWMKIARGAARGQIDGEKMLEKEDLWAYPTVVLRMEDCLAQELNQRLAALAVVDTTPPSQQTNTNLTTITHHLTPQIQTIHTINSSTTNNNAILTRFSTGHPLLTPLEAQQFQHTASILWPSLRLSTSEIQTLNQGIALANLEIPYQYARILLGYGAQEIRCRGSSDPGRSVRILVHVADVLVGKKAGMMSVKLVDEFFIALLTVWADKAKEMQMHVPGESVAGDGDDIEAWTTKCKEMGKMIVVLDGKEVRFEILVTRGESIGDGTDMEGDTTMGDVTEMEEDSKLEDGEDEK